MITTPDGARITRDSITRAFDLHQEAGSIVRWHDWHEDQPGRRRPMFTVVLRGHFETVIDLATLHEAHALCVGLASAERAAEQRVADAFTDGLVIGADGGRLSIIDV